MPTDILEKLRPADNSVRSIADSLARTEDTLVDAAHRHADAAALKSKLLADGATLKQIETAEAAIIGAARDIERLRPFAEKLRTELNAVGLAELRDRHRPAIDAAHVAARAARDALRNAADHCAAIAPPAILALLDAERDDRDAARVLDEALRAANAELAPHGVEPIESPELPPAPLAWFGAEHWQARNFVSAFVCPAFSPGAPLVLPDGFKLAPVPRPTEADLYRRDRA